MRHIACILAFSFLIISVACSGGDPAATVDFRDTPGGDLQRVVIDPDDFELRYSFACEPLNCVTECSIQEGDWFECDSPFSLTESSEEHTVQEGILRFEVRSLHDEEISVPAQLDLLVLHEFDFEIEETHGLDSGEERSYYFEDEFAATCTRNDCELRCYWDHADCADCPVDADCTLDEPFTAELPEGLSTAELVVEACAQDFGGNPEDEHCTDPKTYLFYPAPPGWKSLSTGDQHTCGILDDDTLWCWGLNNSGQLGINSSASPVNTATRVPAVQPGQRWSKVSAGEEHTCAIDTAGALYCWGLQADGRLGNDSASNTTQPVRIDDGPWIAIAAGSRHTCGVQEDGQLFCWGYNGQGQLGDGSTDPSTELRSVSFPVTSPDGWADVTAGVEHTCALIRRTDGEKRAYCWGRARDGRLGNGEDSGFSNTPQAVEGAPASSATHTISAGDTHTCATLTSATGIRTYCWGSGAEGRLGIDTNATVDIPDRVDGEDEFDKVTVGMDHSCGLHGDGRAYCWGEDIRDQLGTGQGQTYEPHPIVMPEGLDIGVADIEAGAEHTCAIGDNGRIYCWGRTTQGRLGIAHSGEVSLPTMISWPQGEHIPE